MRVLHLFRLFAFLWLLGLPSWGQSGVVPSPTPTGPISMTLGSPLAVSTTPLVLTARFGRWFPVAVLLTNSGDAVSGEVRLKLEATSGFNTGGGPPNEFFSRVDLPTNSRKVVWVYGRLERMETTGVQVTFAGRGVRTLAQSLDLRVLDTPQRLVLNLTDKEDNLRYLTTLRGDGLATQILASNNSSSAQLVVPVLGSREMVPDRWIGLEAVDLVVLGDFPHAQLRPSQVEALRGYVVGGGTLLAPTGQLWQRFAQSPLADLWPLRLRAAGAATPTQVTQVVKRYVPVAGSGGDRLGGAPVMLAQGGLVPGAAIRDPAMTMKRTGAGRTIMLAYDPAQPPFIAWNGLPELWKAIFAASAQPARLATVEEGGAWGNANTRPGTGWNPELSEDQSATEALLNAVSRASQLRLPPVSKVAWFLAIYIFVLVPVNYTVLTFLKRKELAWVTVPAIVLVFSLLAYQSALSIRGRAILARQVDIVQATLGGGAGRVDSLLWIFSPSRALYDVQSDNKSAAVAEYVRDRASQASVSIEQPGETGTFVSRDVRLLQWTDKAFVAQSVVNLGSGLQLVPGQKPALKNGTNKPLQGVLWVENKAIRSLGQFAPGQSKTLGSGAYFNPRHHSTAANLAEVSKTQTFLDRAFHQNGVPPLALEAATRALTTSNRSNGLAVAWSTASAAPLSFGHTAQVSKLTVYIFQAP